MIAAGGLRAARYFYACSVDRVGQGIDDCPVGLVRGRSFVFRVHAVAGHRFFCARSLHFATVRPHFALFIFVR